LLFILIGPAGIYNTYGQAEIVKLGMIVTSFEENKVAIDGAQLAIDNANKNANQELFKLVVRSCEGPWGVGSKETVNLIYEDNVWAILGSLDGRNAHLAEQVAAKSHIPLLSSWATDPTLSRAYVPWYMRCIGDDKTNARVMVNQIFQIEKHTKVILVSDDTYDAKMSAESFNKMAGQSGYKIDHYYEYNKLEQNLISFSEELSRYESDAIVGFGNPDFMNTLMIGLNKAGNERKFYSTLKYLEDDHYFDFNDTSFNNLVFITPASWLLDPGELFREDFNKNFGYYPSLKAAYAFDGMNLILGAIRKSGFTIEGIKDNIRETDLVGITGPIAFDNLGNRKGTIELFEVIEGALRLVE